MGMTHSPSTAETTPTPEGKTMTPQRRRSLLSHHVLGREIIRQEDEARAQGIDPEVAWARRNAILADNVHVRDRRGR